MKIALLGYGKMGKCIERLADHPIVCRISSDQKGWEKVPEADLCIDFSHPHAVLGNLKKCSSLQKNLVIGTTGWERDLENAKKIIEEYGIGALYAPNFSLGMYLFMQLLQYSAQAIQPFKEYDVGGLEMHHKHKKDAPSGSALEISKRLKEILSQDIPFTSLRLGSILGKHTVLFDSSFDTITLSHEAKNRDGFALGALQAAEWLLGKKGFFSLNDFIQEAYL